MKMVPRMFGVLAAGLLMFQAAGCAGASAPAARWAKSGASVQSFASDHLACRSEAKTAEMRPAPFATAAQTNALEGDRLYASCMTARGYRPDPQGFAPPEQSSIVSP